MTVALLALAALGNATTNGNYPICDASPKEAKVSSATVALRHFCVNTMAMQNSLVQFSSTNKVFQVDVISSKGVLPVLIEVFLRLFPELRQIV